MPENVATTIEGYFLLLSLEGVPEVLEGVPEVLVGPLAPPLVRESSLMVEEEEVLLELSERVEEAWPSCVFPC